MLSWQGYPDLSGLKEGLSLAMTVVSSFLCYCHGAGRDWKEHWIWGQTDKGFECWLPHLREKEIATHSSTLAWKIPWMDEPDRLQSVGSSQTQLSDFTIFTTNLLYPFIHL